MDWHRISLVFLVILLTQCSNHKVRCVMDITDVRLVGGPTPDRGTVEIRIDNGTWATTCGVYLSISDVIVICRQLGFTGANIAIRDTPYGQNSTPIGGFNCNGVETDLSECGLFPSTIACSDAGGASCHGHGYLGCFIDQQNNLVLPGDGLTDDTKMTISYCIQFCNESTKANYTYAGVENGEECYCGEGDAMYSKRGEVPNALCQIPCSGDPTESCGGSGFIDIFNISMVTPTTVSSPISPTLIGLSSTNLAVITDNGSTAATSAPSTTYMTPQTTSALPLTGTNTGLYAGIDGGVSAFIILLIIIVTIFIMGRRSRKRRKDTVQNNNGRLSVDYALPDKNGNEPRNDYEGITNEMAPHASVDNVNPMRPRTMPNMNDRLSVVYAAPDKNGKGPRNDTSEDCGSLYAIPDKPRGQPDGNDDGIVHGLYAKADESLSGDQYEPEMVENELYTI